MPSTLEQQAILLRALQNPALYDHPVEKFEVQETHISWVILTGPYAYKLKKAVDFGFLDYGTLEKRHLQCTEELRLNRRTAPQLYLDVVPIGGGYETPQLHAEPAIEYMVKMRQFPQSGLMSHLLKSGKLTAEQMRALGTQLAGFHQKIEVSGGESPYGTPEMAYYPVGENFRQIGQRIDDADYRNRLDRLEQWAVNFFEQNREIFLERKASGFIRDCHGDLHLNNIVLLDGQPVLFDCIEFNPRLRIIDVISEVAFLIMDLQEHRREDFAATVLNRYLELSGDYAGLHLLRFYQSYRAMVRAKVAVLRLDQTGLDPKVRAQTMNIFANYLALAERYTQTEKPRLFITHGLSGSGKTTLSEPLLGAFGAIRLRSDIERKRLFGLGAEDDSASAVAGGIYTAEASRATYQRLADLAGMLLKAGFNVIVDATFLKRRERDQFRVLADDLNIPFTILHFHASAETLREWVRQRTLQGGDASEAGLEVLEHQLASYMPLDEDERPFTIVIDSETIDIATMPAIVREAIE